VRLSIFKIFGLEIGSVMVDDLLHREDMRIGIIACGYADGYPRHAKDGTPVWVSSSAHSSDGVSCPLVGRVSMEMSRSSRNAPNAKIGSVVESWGVKCP
jgi:alanine racemase